MRADSGDPTGPPRGLSRRARSVLVAVEAAAAGILGGVVVGGALGTTIVVLTVVVTVAGVLLVRGRWLQRSAGQAGDTARFVAGLRVLGVRSRSSGEVGVIGDGQGFAAGIEIDIAKGAELDLGALCSAAATDPSRPSALQLRLTAYGPPTPSSGVFRRRHGSAVALHRRLHVFLRLEPTWAGDVVETHGGGAQGSRAALVAAVDRLAAGLRRAGVINRVLDAGALDTLLAEDTAATSPQRLFAADPGSQADLDRLTALVAVPGVDRSIVSFCVELAGSDQWQSFATVHITTHDVEQRDAVSAGLLADPAVDGVAVAGAIAAVLPLGGGPGDLASVLTLARV